MQAADESSLPEAQVTSIAVTNTAPTARPDFYWMPAGDSLIVMQPGVLRNDRDAENDFLIPYIQTGPSSGTADVDLFGAVSYAPHDGFTGTDSFTYRVFDGSLYSDPVTVTVLVGIEVAGTARREKLVGTEAAEIFRPCGGSDNIWLGGGTDLVVFGNETANGVVEITRIFGFGSDDMLDLGGATVVSAREQKNGWLRLTLDGDGDVILVHGVTRADLDDLF